MANVDSQDHDNCLRGWGGVEAGKVFKQYLKYPPSYTPLDWWFSVRA